MAKSGEKLLNEEERKAIFLALVEAQDEVGVAESRKAISVRFGIEETQVRRIEQEGLDAGWPPLD